MTLRRKSTALIAETASAATACDVVAVTVKDTVALYVCVEVAPQNQ